MKYWKAKYKPWKGRAPRGDFFAIQNQIGEEYYIKAPKETDDLDPAEWLAPESIEPGAYFVKFSGFFPFYGHDFVSSLLFRNQERMFGGRSSFIVKMVIKEKTTLEKVKSQFLKDYKKEIKKDKINGKLKAQSVKVDGAVFFFVCRV